MKNAYMLSGKSSRTTKRVVDDSCIKNAYGS